MKRRALLVLAMVSGLGATACGPPWQVISQATPNPMVGAGEFAVMPVDFTGLTVGDGSESEYLADKDEETRGKWAGDKTAMNVEFTKALRGQASESGIKVVEATGPGAKFTIQPKVVFIEPGFFTSFVNKASETEMIVYIVDESGAKLDEISMKHSTPASLVNAGVGHRLRDDAEGLGGYMGEYLAARTNPGG